MNEEQKKALEVLQYYVFFNTCEPSDCPCCYGAICDAVRKERDTPESGNLLRKSCQTVVQMIEDMEQEHEAAVKDIRNMLTLTHLCEFCKPEGCQPNQVNCWAHCRWRGREKKNELD